MEYDFKENREHLNFAYEELMPHRIKNVLLVASHYDSFLLAENERLSEAVFENILLQSSPKIKRVPTGKKAIDEIKTGEYDLVIGMTQIGDMDMENFVRAVRRISLDIPLVLLSFNIQDILNISASVKKGVNKIFMWHGDTRLFSSIINVIEDELNFDHDSRIGVQAILLVEDSVRFYSSYLPIIYTEILKQTQIVIADELNPSRKIDRMKARPKILLAENYETAWKLFNKYTKNIISVISDVEFPYGKNEKKEAGILLVKKVKRKIEDLPVLLQSSNVSHKEKALKVGAYFINKNSPDLGSKLRRFILENFGLGDFVFVVGGKEVARAQDLHSLLKTVKTVPASSLIYHAKNNHFSKWLFARTEFEIAYHIRPKKISEFKDGEELRQYLVEVLHQFISKTQQGSILKFDRRFFDTSTPFSKIGSGSIGGKARGLSFADFLLSRKDLIHDLPQITVKTPNTVTVATDVFDFFVDQNNIMPQIEKVQNDNETIEIFEKSRLPTYLIKDLEAIIETLRGPLAVRSSSLLEDSKTQPFAGIYKTYMLPNNHPNKSVRLAHLINAIKYVYASTFSKEAMSYRQFSPHIPDDEKMAVIIQKVVGKFYPRSGRFYPNISGIVQSYNFYPVYPLIAEEPVAHVCLGLGKTIVEGYHSLRFSPSHPRNIHQFSTTRDYFNNTQKKFAALYLGPDVKDNYDDPNVNFYDVQEAENDGSISLVCSTYSPENDIFYEGLREQGTRVITFAPILKSEIIPLCEVILRVVDYVKRNMVTNIEIEFALNYDAETKKSEFYILQIRPMISRSFNQKISFDDIDEKSVVFDSNLTLGNGRIDGIKDIVLVNPETFSTLRTHEIAMEIEKFNNELKKECRNYILVGPGRWGSSDSLLGVPVRWNQISNAKVMIETKYPGLFADPSYGTHFFHNITSLGIGYLTINSEKNGRVNWDLLKKKKVLKKLKYVSLIRLKKDLDIRINGSKGRAVIMERKK